MTSGITVPQKKKIIPAVSIWHSEKQSPAPHFYVLFFSSFQWFLAISCPTSRAHAGTRSSPVILARIRTRTTASVSAPRVSRTCVTTWEPDSTRMCATSTGNTFACAACRTFTSSVSQSVARQTCFTDSWCFQSLNLTPLRSHTGGPGNASVRLKWSGSGSVMLTFAAVWFQKSWRTHTCHVVWDSSYKIFIVWGSYFTMKMS